MSIRPISHAPHGPLRVNMTSSKKPKVHNILHCGQRRTEPRPQLTCTSRLVFTARLRPQFRMPPVRGSVVRIRGMMRAQHFWIRTSLSSTSAAPFHATSTAATRYDRREVAGMANFKMYLLCQFCSYRVEIFLQYTGDIDAKNDGPEF